MKKIIFIAITLCSAIVSAQNIDTAKINDLINSKIKDTDPALTVGIVKDGAIVYQYTRGLANLEHSVKANNLTTFNIASTAKQFTALMVLQLSLEQKLTLEDDIRTYLPKLYPTVKEKIRIRHLLNHTSGVRDYPDLMSVQREPWWRRVGLDNNDVLELLEKQEDLAFKPGSKKTYSNSGYTILTKIIENVSGQSFYEYSKQFFKELGMINTVFSKNYMAVIPNRALPYSDWSGNGVWQEFPMLTNLNGDGFLFTTLKDQLIYEQAVQNAAFNNNVLLIESQKPIPNSEIKTYGFGLKLENRLNYKAVHHSGGTGSYNSQVVRYPNEKLTIYVMSNNSTIWSGYIADAIANTILPKQKQNMTYDDSINTIPTVEKSDLSRLVGQYRSPEGVIIRIEEKDDTLYWKMDNNNPMTLQYEKGNIYALADNTTTKINFEVDKSMTVYWPDATKRIYKKISLFKPTITDLEDFVGEYYSKELDVSFSILLNEDNKLMAKMKKRKTLQAVEVINKNDLLISHYRIQVNRDAFNRVMSVLVTTNRVLNMKFIKKTNLQFQPKIPTDNGSINVTTIGSRGGNSSQILLTKNYSNGNEIWSKQFGGKSYDKASSIIATDNGYLIIGSTSSYGKGNYDMFVIKTDKKGKTIWQNTYGNFYNDYGYTAEKTDTGYLIKGTTQDCTSNTDVFNRTCKTNVWFVAIDNNGKELSSTILEEIK